MGFIVRAMFGLGVVVALFFGVVFGASEMAGEVVTLRTYQGDGLGRETSLWIVDDGEHHYLRGGLGSGWVDRVLAIDRVEVVRAGQAIPYRAVVERDARILARVNGKMAAKYGVADRLIGLMRDEATTVAVRLAPIRN